MARLLQTSVRVVLLLPIFFYLLTYCNLFPLNGDRSKCCLKSVGLVDHGGTSCMSRCEFALKTMFGGFITANNVSLFSSEQHRARKKKFPSCLRICAFNHFHNIVFPFRSRVDKEDPAGALRALWLADDRELNVLRCFPVTSSARLKKPPKNAFLFIVQCSHFLFFWLLS